VVDTIKAVPLSWLPNDLDPAVGEEPEKAFYHANGYLDNPRDKGGIKEQLWQLRPGVWCHMVKPHSFLQAMHLQ